MLDYKLPVRIEEELHSKVQRSVKKISGGQPFPILILAHPQMDVGDRARKDGTKDSENTCCKAMAIVCKTLAQKIVGNFYIRVQRPARPTRIFNSREDAVKWLRSLD